MNKMSAVRRLQEARNMYRISIDRDISSYFKEIYERNEASEIQIYRKVGLACNSQIWLMEFFVLHLH